MSPVHQQPGIDIYHGDCRDVLAQLPAESVNCCVTSPPYWGLRDYGVAGQIGQEPTPAAFVETMAQVFREVRRVLTDDGTLWLNLGDSYNAYNGNRGPASGANKNHHEVMPSLPSGYGLSDKSLKPKDLCGIPWRVALALQSDGWYLRSDIIWHKPNPMPESVTDRPTKSHEYIFLLSKSDRYFYDSDAIAEPAVADHPAGNQTHKYLTAYDAGDARHRTKAGLVAYAQRTNGKHSAADKQAAGRRMVENTAAARAAGAPHENPFGDTRNARSVWTITTKPYPGAHFATFPPELPERCIKAGCPAGGVVLDPFHGSGTTAQVARKWGRRYVGIELNHDYIELSKDRVRQEELFALPHPTPSVSVAGERGKPVLTPPSAEPEATR